MYKQTLWYEIYAGRKINQENFHKYFGKNGDDETWYIYYVEIAGEPQFELHAYIDGDTVVRVETFKADVYAGHGKPIIDEKELTSSEKKYAIEIFDECFIDRVGDSLQTIIDDAISREVEFGGYRALKKGKDHIVFLNGDGLKAKLQFRKLLQAMDYSHLDLSVLRDEGSAKELAYCLNLKLYEPLFAVLQIIDPSTYPEYIELERKYRYEKLECLVQSGELESCVEYIDVLKDSNNNIAPLCGIAIENNNEELLKWLIHNTENAQCDLGVVMNFAIKKDKEELFYYLLNSGLYDASTSESERWDTPMYAAADYKGREKYVLPLLEHGFSLPAKIAHGLYARCSLDELLALLPYKITLDQNVVNRIYLEDRKDIIECIEKKPLKYCDLDMLFEAYVQSGDFEKFSKLLEDGYKNESYKLFKTAYYQSSRWTDLWIRCGFDINCNSAKLLHDACRGLESDFAIYLLENGANPHLREHDYSQTVFEEAGGFHGFLNEQQEKDKERICKYLMNMGLSPIEESRRSPSILAYMMGISEEFDMFLIDWLAEHNCINSPDMAAKNGEHQFLPVGHVLKDIGWKYNPRTLRYFIERGAILNAEGITDEKLFIQACRFCELPELQLVVAAGANIFEVDKKGDTGLVAAAKWSRPMDVIEYLVELGLDVNGTSTEVDWNHGMKKIYVSILDIAEEKCNENVAEYLKSKGALHYSEIGENKQ